MRANIGNSNLALFRLKDDVDVGKTTYYIAFL